MTDVTITDEWVATLLQMPAGAEQLAHLRQAHLLTAEGLETLLNIAERRAGANPQQTQQLAMLCEAAADHAAAPAALPHAAYLRAQVHAMKGEFETAHQLIDQARSGYETLGLTLEALRTNVGLMRVLGQSGNYQQALALGQQVLDQLGSVRSSPPDKEPAEPMLVAALIYQNCGHCHEQIGQYDEALKAYAGAEIRYHNLGMVERLGQIIENRGLVLLALGRVHDALTAFQRALQIYEQGDFLLYQAQTLTNIGEAHLLLGHYTQSLATFEEATRFFAALDELTDEPILWRHMGDAYLALNLYGEALDAYRKARPKLEATGLSYHYALTLWGMGMALAGSGQSAAAEELLAQAAQRLGQLENQPLRSALMLEQATLLAARGEQAAARTLAQEALALVVNSNWTVQKIYAYMRNADLLLPDVAAAAPLLREAEALVKTLALPQLRYRLDQRLGRLCLLQGDTAAAQTHLERAVAEIERVRSTLVQERMRASFLDDKVTAYQDLVQLYLDRGDAQSIQQAFAVAERAKSRSLVDLLSGVIESAPDAQPEPEVATQLQQMQAELNAIYNELLGAGENNLRTGAAAMRYERAVELEQAISRLQLQTTLKSATQEPIAAEPPPPTVPADLPLLAYYVLGSEILAFLCTAGRIQVVRHLCTVEEVQTLLERLNAQWDYCRIGATFLQRHVQRLEQSARALLHQLYQRLVAPVAPLLAHVAPTDAEHPGRLVIAPHALLHQAPFHALHDGERYWVERWAISYAPSATAFELCRQRRLRKDRRALVLGVADARIQSVQAETRQVARSLQPHFAQVDVLLDAGATVQTLPALVPTCGVLHLACHGLFRADNPMFSALKLHDGWLTAATVAKFQLDCPLVTLSACESGRYTVLGGDEIIGLVHAFLGAGAATLLVSQWLVQDSSAALLMETWYNSLAQEEDLAAALRKAQLAVMAQYPHPYFWAPFILIGQRATFA